MCLVIVAVRRIRSAGAEHIVTDITTRLDSSPSSERVEKLAQIRIPGAEGYGRATSLLRQATLRRLLPARAASVLRPRASSAPVGRSTGKNGGPLLAR